jgi:putative transposase
MMTKNEQIRQTLRNTSLKRKTQTVKVFELKVDCHHTSKEDFKKLSGLFREAKWIQNDVIASKDVFHYEYKEHRTVRNFDKDHNIVERKLTMQTGVHQNIIKHVQTDIMNLSKAKNKGRHVGKLRFRKECNCIPLKTGMLKVSSSKRISIPMFRNLAVYGLEQFINIPGYEVANANIIRKASGYYIKVTVYIPKESARTATGKTVGLDFGIKDNITTSDGEKYNCSVQEDDHFKFLQRKLAKKQKGSKRYYRCLCQIKRTYEHQINKRDDDSNKLMSHLLKTYDIIYFQDEQISQWKKFNKGFAHNIQHSYMGRIKARLVELEKSGRSFEISRWVPTTKACPVCGSINTGITLNDRIYKCDCGYEYDRDIHAARNVKMFGSTKRAECLERTSVDSLVNTSLLVKADNAANSLVEAKNKAVSL